MKVCLLCPEPTDWADVSCAVESLARTLAAEHEVTLLRSGFGAAAARAPQEACGGIREAVAVDSRERDGILFASDDHAHGAAVLEALRELYGEQGPDYLEAPDFRGHGLVAMQARRGGDPLLAKTTIAVRLVASTELICLHDGSLGVPGRRRLAAIEREQLRLADRLVWPGGDSLGLLGRYFEGLDLPPAVRIPPPLPVPRAGVAAPRPAAGPLRILYAGPLQWHRGALDLAEACLSLPHDEWELTLAGEDTDTAPMRQSVRATIEAISGDDPRISFLPEVPLRELGESVGAYDLLAVPSRVQAWSAEAVVALAAGVPVLASPVGGLTEIVEDGVTGWLCGGSGAAELAPPLARLLGDRDEVARLRGSAELAARATELSDPQRALDAYRELRAAAAPAAPPPRAAAEEPLVTGVIPYHDASPYVADAVASLLDQTHRNLEVLIVNDGSFRAADAVLDELARDARVTVVNQPNRGESSARDLGARLAAGEYLAMLDADNMLEPTFVERCLATYRADPSLAYVTCWLRMVDVAGAPLPTPQGYAPLGNAVLSDECDQNWDGDTIALLPRKLFAEQGFGYRGAFHSDWAFYRDLRRAGRIGAVIPAQLARYRIVPSSLLRAISARIQQRSWDEFVVRRRLAETAWLAGGPA